jgi:hypothetical protein
MFVSMSGWVNVAYHTCLLEGKHRLQGAVFLQRLPGGRGMKLEHVEVVGVHAGQTLLDACLNVIRGESEPPSSYATRSSFNHV